MALDQFITELLSKSLPFQGLPKNDLESLLRGKITEISYQTGDEILAGNEVPSSIHIITEGSVRLLGSDKGEHPVSLELMNPGAVVGLFSLATRVPCEKVRAASSVKTLAIPAENILRFFALHPSWAEALHSKSSLGELFPLICDLLRVRGFPLSAGKKMAAELLPYATAFDEASTLPDDVSLTILQSENGRKIGIPSGRLSALLERLVPEESSLTLQPGNDRTPHSDGTDAAGHSTSHSEIPDLIFSPSSAVPPFHKAANSQESIIACLKMLAGQLNLPFREAVIRSALRFQLEGRSPLSFPRIGSVADMIGIATQPLRLPLTSLKDQETPFLMILSGSPVVVQQVSHHGLFIANPLAQKQEWIDWQSLASLHDPKDEGYPILLTRRSRSPQGESFGFGTFLPYIRKHTRTFIEVVIASLFIQVFALATPLIIQVIIDKVIVQESLSTLDVLGGLLIICTLFGAALTAIRTFLFTDATNRIDLSVGLKILEHLYRLPLSYFHQRPVGEIASRLRELDKIRSFLTGTALTALLDAAFSVVYVAIMLFYSVKLTIVALLGVPLLAALTLLISPIIRRQLKDRAEKNAATESHLVESITGIQTIKGQNIETRSRWKWYQRYGETISSSFRNTLTSTSASTIGTLINRFNDVAVLWVGVYLVVDQKMSLGQLIAFRILAGYVTGPLLRLAQSWQSFQEAALSVNRLGDVANRAREDEGSEEQIPIPEIQGRVICRDLDFGYAPGKHQIEHLSLDVPAGKLIAMVGLSGSGKSTLLKLIGRLYEPVKGSVEIDGFDLSKVELNSLRHQIGMVFQETLLMEGSVMDNISLSNPDATSAEVIEAAKLAEAHDFIMTLPNGYATPVGEQGRNLSGGQRQRIALARLIIQSPNLLLLDEATSALDAPTEARVITNLRERFHGKTIFFATHRLSTVRLADQIYYLQNGLLMEHGTHAELMHKKGLYYSLMLQQEGS
jgi:ATP-binding cassette subfamily B protein